MLDKIRIMEKFLVFWLPERVRGTLDQRQLQKATESS